MCACYVPYVRQSPVACGWASRPLHARPLQLEQEELPGLAEASRRPLLVQPAETEAPPVYWETHFGLQQRQQRADAVTVLQDMPGYPPCAPGPRLRFPRLYSDRYHAHVLIAAPAVKCAVSPPHPHARVEPVVWLPSLHYPHWCWP